jgi:hypothetical protein
MQTQNHNVILFGAGASFDAGIPLMSNFVDVMWDYAFRGKVGNNPLSDADRAIFSEANKIRDSLESYNSRASFDNRNLEDILSLLLFEALGSKAETLRYQTVVKAVARTIELSSRFQYWEGIEGPAPSRDSPYHNFWSALLGGKFQRANLPALITFNYDLVFERTLWEYFHYLNNSPAKPAVRSCSLKYAFGMNAFSIKKATKFFVTNQGGSTVDTEGQGAEFMTDQNIPRENTDADIPYFKLHGSLNWSRENPLDHSPHLPIQAVEKPLILPPVFNKMNVPEINDLWKTALETLRKAVNIIIVGYSLPQTDIYMQYFLKAAVGPNSNLQQIIVFDPVLYDVGEKREAMMQRYRQCFSPQFNSRITFNPSHNYPPDRPVAGTFSHFVRLLHDAPQALFFVP